MPKDERPTLVLKVGGSLLDWPELPRRLESLLLEGRPALVAGGGAAADVIRSLDRVHGLGQEQAHRLAIRAMDLTAALLAALLPRSLVVSNPEELAATWRASQVPILAPKPFLEASEAGRTDTLPASWDVTSDSIAARLARHLRVDRLVLLKSVRAEGITTLEQAAVMGLVDPHFPTAAAGFARVEVVCLRDSPIIFRRLQGAPASAARTDS
jgi:aspartokinase-like uncharacterized kinase